MKPVALLLLLTAIPASAHDPHRDRIIGSASELREWCRAEAEMRYAAKGIPTYQWTASYHEKGNTLYVNGKLRANGNDVEVRCRIARDVRAEYASIEIDDPSL